MGKISQIHSDTELNVSEQANLKPKKTDGAIIALEKASLLLNRGLAWLAGIFLVLMMLLVVGNGLIRNIYVPFYGTPEIVGWLGALTTAFALGYTQLHKGHIDIDILVEKFPDSLKRWLHGIMLLASTVFFLLITWKIFQYALTVMENGNLSETMRIAFYPIIILADFGFLGLSLALLVEWLKLLRGGSSK